MISGLDPVADIDVFNNDYSGLFNVSPAYPPTAFVHGSLDNEVEVNQAIIMNDALVSAGVDTELIVVSNAEHLLHNLPAEEQDVYWRQARLFLDQYLK